MTFALVIVTAILRLFYSGFVGIVGKLVVKKTEDLDVNKSGTFASEKRHRIHL